MSVRASGAALAAALMATALPAAPLRMIAIDVEGGAATLYVTPKGHSLLVDTGWPAGLGGPRAQPGQPAPPPAPSSAQAIVAAARKAGLSRIDYVLITHYHVDHVGGVADLVKSFPVGTFIDHGPNREQPKADAPGARLTYAPVTTYPAYLAAIAGHPRRSLKAGEHLRIDDLDVIAVDSDRAVLERPLGGAGKPGKGCGRAVDEADSGGEENPRSLGILLQWGKARILSLADTTWQVENKLVCPVDRIGPVDIMLADNHGSDNSNSPALLDTVQPRLIMIANGATKGAGTDMFERIAAMRQRPTVWQLHYATRAAEKNAPQAQIVNLDAADDAHQSLEVWIERSGDFAVSNPRTGATEQYRR